MTNDVKKIKNQYVDNSYGINEILTLYFTGNISEAYNALNNRVYNLISNCFKNMKCDGYDYYVSSVIDSDYIVNDRIKDIIEKHKSFYKLLGKDIPENLVNITAEKYLKIRNLLKYNYE